MTETDSFEALGAEEKRPARRVACYVALGDSFSAGVGWVPGLAWPDHLADQLRRRNPDLVYRNLAVEGARSAQVLDQVPVALQLEPDLVTVVCGLNDFLLSTRLDVLAYTRNLASIFRALDGALGSVEIVTATAPEGWSHLDVSERVSDRLKRGAERLNRATRAMASAYGVGCVEIAGHPGLARPENIAADGLHPSAEGHSLAAREFIRALGQEAR